MATFYANIQSSKLGAIDANTVAQWRFNNNFLDNTANGHTLTKVGVLGFSTTDGVWEGGYSSGAYSNAKYCHNSTSAASLVGTSGWTLEGVSQFVTTVGNQQFITCGNTPPDYASILYHNGFVKLVVDDSVKSTSSEVVASGIKYYWAIKSSSDNTIEFYFNVASTDPATLVGSATGVNYGIWPASSLIQFARIPWSTIWAFSGYHDYVTLSNVARPILPTPRP